MDWGAGLVTPASSSVRASPDAPGGRDDEERERAHLGVAGRLLLSHGPHLESRARDAFVNRPVLVRENRITAWVERVLQRQHVGGPVGSELEFESRWCRRDALSKLTKWSVVVRRDGARGGFGPVDFL